MQTTTTHPAMDVARTIAATALAGLAVGIVVVGGGGRLMMRIAGATAPPVAQGQITEAGFRVGEVTAGGTIGLILFVGIFGGIATAVLFGVTRPWIERFAWPATLSGLVFVAAGSAISDLLNPDNRDFAILRRPVLDVALVLGLLWSVGAAIAAIAPRVERRLPDGSGLSGGLYALVGLASVPISVGVLSAFFRSDMCDCDPPVFASTSVVVMAIGTVGLMTARIGRRDWRWPTLLGLGGLTGVLVFGLARAVSDAAAIIG